MNRPAFDHRFQDRARRLGLLLVLGILLPLGGCQEKEYVHVGQRWAALNQLQPPANAMRVQVRAPDQGQVGDAVEFRVTPRESGYLWVVQVDSRDQVALLFPNELEMDHAVEKDRERVIPGAPGYRLTLDRPTGAQLLAFIVTSDPDGLARLLPPAVIQEAGLLPARAESWQQPMGVTLDSQRRWGLEKRVLTVR